MGSKDDGSDSLAVQVAPASHWPSMRAIILVASAEKKGVSSTSGMQQTVATSDLFQHRASTVVPKRMKEMKEAIATKDFEAFATLTMRDSNGFHATCADTLPPIFYMNDTSKAAVRVVEGLNRAAGRTIAAYTFDAGPNAVVYYLEEDEKSVAGALKAVLDDKEGWEQEKGVAIEATAVDGLDEVAIKGLKEGISRIILTGVGEGPVKVEEHLVDETGNAKYLE